MDWKVRLHTLLAVCLIASAASCTDSAGDGAACTAARSCARDPDCPAGYVCDASGCCRESAPCTPGSCPAGTYCSARAECRPSSEQCTEVGGGCRCAVIGNGGELQTAGIPVITLTPDASRRVQVVVTLPDGNPLSPGEQPLFEIANDALFEIDGDTLTALDSATRAATTLTATLGGATCAAELVNLGPPPSDGNVRLFVFDELTGLPVAGAEVHVDYDHNGVHDGAALPLVTGTNGITTTTIAASGSYDVTVFANGYNYLSLAGISAPDIAVPMSPLDDPPVVGGATGRLDWTRYEQQVLDGSSKAIRVGLVGSSFPLESLLNFDITLFVGPIFESDCDVDPLPAGCFQVTIPGLVDRRAHLPGGIIFSLASTPIKDHFDVIGRPGRRILWGIGAEMDASELTDLVDLLVPNVACVDCPFEYGHAVNSLVPLLSRFSLGPRSDVSLSGVSLDEWVSYITPAYGERTDTTPPRFELHDVGGYGRVPLTRPLTRFAEVPVPPLPIDPASGLTMEGVVVLTAVEVDGFGVVPLGAGTGLDCPEPTCLDRASDPLGFDGIVDGTYVCGPNADNRPCLPGVPERIADGHVGVFYSDVPPALRGYPLLTLIAALPVVSLAEEGTLPRVAAFVVRGGPDAAVALSASAFPPFEAPPEPLVDRTYATTGGGSADVHFVTILPPPADPNVPERRWSLYMAGGAASFTAPDVPVGWPDPVGTLPTRIEHAGFALAGSGHTLDSLASQDGTVLTDIVGYVDRVTYNAILQDVP